MLPITPENFPHGIVCGCDCGCSKPLNDGNSMGQDITDNPATPWEKADPDEARIVKAICADCYVGAHEVKA